MKSIVETIRKVLSLPGRLSVAAKAACCLVLGLVVLLAGVWIWYTHSPRHIPWSAYMSWSRAAILGILILSVAAVAYFTIRTWLTEQRADRTIRTTWAAGMRELRSCGLPLDGLPIHLILGAGSGDDADRLIQASGDYRVRQQPRGSGGFQFSANPNRLCLSAGGVGLVALARAALAPEIDRWSPDDDGQLSDDVSIAAEEDDQEVYPDTQHLLQALQEVGLESNDDSEDEWSEGEAWSNGGLATALERPKNQIETCKVPRPITLLQDPLAATTTPLWTLGEAAEADHSLRQLASLLRSGRRPLCPINRILVAVPAAVLLGATHRIPELKRAIRRDLETLKETLQINAPVTVVVSGLESHPGFVELIRRAGPQLVRQQALGQALEVGSATNPAQLESLAVNACGQVEDAIYALLRKDSTLSSPGNTALYRLLCDVRTGIRQALRDLLVGAFTGEDAATSVAGQSVAGCFFCAAGASPQQTGFVEPVLRLQDRAQEELEWFPRALRRDAFHRQLSRMGWMATAGLTLLWVCLMGTWLAK